jgi:hypothetical protein
VAFYIHTAMFKKISVFLDITPFSSLKVNRRFGSGLFFDSEHGGDVLPKRQLTFIVLHVFTSQKIELFWGLILCVKQWFFLKENTSSLKYIKIVNEKRWKKQFNWLYPPILRVKKENKL